MITATFNIDEMDSKSAITINFKSLLWEINLKGLKTLSNLKILMKGIFML